jgi:hypothetical protein
MVYAISMYGILQRVVANIAVLFVSFLLVFDDLYLRCKNTQVNHVENINKVILQQQWYIKIYKK